MKSGSAFLWFLVERLFLCLRVLSENSIASPLSPLGMTVHDSFSKFLHQVVPSPYCEKSKLFDTFFLSTFLTFKYRTRTLCRVKKHASECNLLHIPHSITHPLFLNPSALSHVESRWTLQFRKLKIDFWKMSVKKIWEISQ